MAIEKQKKYLEQELSEVLVRIMGNDIPGSKNIYSGLTRIKGISWTVSNVVLRKLNFHPSKKISELTKDEIKKIESFLDNIQMFDFLKNRRLDQTTGKSEHYLTNDLDLKKEFDIKRMKKIRSYKGVRHSSNLPVRGQRTRSHFRAKGLTVGVRRKR